MKKNNHDKGEYPKGAMGDFFKAVAEILMKYLIFLRKLNGVNGIRYL